tara:strand:- start:3724 stop:4782 length:1059 start_codon:yes stop_codon:yes gene_type:complete
MNKKRYICKMRNLITIFLLFFFVSEAQIKDFFKYSTVYTSSSMSTPFSEREDYIAIDKGYENVTQIHPYDYNITFGIRKIARFDYEYKVKTWYYGTEKAVADNVTIGNANGWEYLLNYSFIRNRGNSFTEQNFWLRYLGTKSVTKLQYTDNQRVDLRYSSFDTRYRINKGNWDFTAGVCFRVHNPYGINPIEDFWTPGESTFNQLAGDFGYSTQYVNGRWHWFNSDSELIATSNDEFFKHYFGDAVASFNERELEKLGLQKELSAVFGVAYYKYQNNFWLHVWGNILPLHYGLDEYSYEYGQDDFDLFEWDAGIVLGVRLNKHLGLFVEGTHMKYWMKPVFDVKFGFNYLIF